MEPAHPFGEAFIRPQTDPRLDEGAIEPEIDLRHASGRCEFPVILLVIAAERG